MFIMYIIYIYTYLLENKTSNYLLNNYFYKAL